MTGTGRAARTVTMAAMLAAGLLATAGALPAAAVTPPPKWIHIAAGLDFSCGIREGNTLWCWGSNQNSDLGHGPGPDADLPQQITRPTAAWTGVTVGEGHACATRKDGGLWCWGNNGWGQLGLGTPAASAGRPHQVTTPAADGWASAAAGADHTCAVRTDDTLWCWGDNQTGQLGLGSTADQDLPQQVTTPAAGGWASVAAGGLDTCAVRSDATLWCWGFGLYGQLGLGGTGNQDLPQQVTPPAAGGWSRVTASGLSTCAVRGDTTLWCWGYNRSGETGTGTTVQQDLPQQVTSPAVDGWTAVAAGLGHTCATRTDALWCWGSNLGGELGIGRGIPGQDLPSRVSLPSRTGWTLLAAGDFYACATRTGHALWCWGDNDSGQLGIGGHTRQYLPQQITS